MAIQITEQPVNPPFPAYNNSIIEFGLDVGVPSVANVTAAGNVFPIFPNPDGKFYFDFETIIQSLVNTNHFSDDLVSTSTSYLLNDDSLSYELAVSLEVILEDGTSQTSNLTLPFTKSVEQIIRKRFIESELKLLSHGATRVAYLSYFEGYPFDVSIYSDIARTVTIKNVKTGMSFDYSFTKGVNRLFISNGENDNGGFENDIPLHLGVNELEFKVSTTIKFTLFLDKKEAECGKLLKWFNPSGGWSYWRFMDLFIDNIKSDSKERISKNTQNLHNSIGNFSITGKELENENQLLSGLVTDEERNILDTLLASPKVFLYTNELHQPFDKYDFVEVQVGNGTFSRSNKNKLNNLSVNILLPKIYTQSL